MGNREGDLDRGSSLRWDGEKQTKAPCARIDISLSSSPANRFIHATLIHVADEGLATFNSPTIGKDSCRCQCQLFAELSIAHILRM